MTKEEIALKALELAIYGGKFDIGECPEEEQQAIDYDYDNCKDYKNHGVNACKQCWEKSFINLAKKIAEVKNEQKT